MAVSKTIETIDSNKPADIAVAILALMTAAANNAGRTIHPDEFMFADSTPVRLALVETTLTDGSKVYNIGLDKGAESHAAFGSGSGCEISCAHLNEASREPRAFIVTVRAQEDDEMGGRGEHRIISKELAEAFDQWKRTDQRSAAENAAWDKVLEVATSKLAVELVQDGDFELEVTNVREAI